MKKLAQMYETGDYVAKDEDKARYWREKEQNSTDNYKEWNSYAGEEYASKDEHNE